MINHQQSKPVCIEGKDHRTLNFKQAKKCENYAKALIDYVNEMRERNS